MSDSHGQFCWCELMTTDEAAAAAFYRDVIGWTASDAGPAHPGYTIMSAGGTGVAGIAPQPQRLRDAGLPPFWMGYIAADDVDSVAGKAAEAGGSVRRSGNIEGVGRFAVLADPQGAVFTVLQPLPPEQDPPPRPQAGATPGHVGWHELHAGEREAAFAFYADLFGWSKTEAIDLGPMGIYQTFATGGVSGSNMVGGMMTRTDAVPAPVWLHYFNVDDIDAAASRARQSGGEVLMGPHEVPGGSWIAQCKDPQGAFFSVVGPRC